VQSAVEARLGTRLEPLSRRGRGRAEGADEAALFTQTDFYHNTFTALPATRTWRPHTATGHGLRRHPHPSASGAQSAIVVGAGEPVHTDRDHRIIVQQHWQRGQNAANRLDHPREANAPADAG